MEGIKECDKLSGSFGIVKNIEKEIHVLWGNCRLGGELLAEWYYQPLASLHHDSSKNLCVQINGYEDTTVTQATRPNVWPNVLFLTGIAAFIAYFCFSISSSRPEACPTTTLTQPPLAHNPQTRTHNIQITS